MSVVDGSKYRQTNVYSLRDRQLLRTPPDSWGEMPSETTDDRQLVRTPPDAWGEMPIETADEDKQPPHLDWWWTRLMRRIRRE